MTRGRYYDQGVDAYWLDETDGEGTGVGDGVTRGVGAAVGQTKGVGAGVGGQIQSTRIPGAGRKPEMSQDPVTKFGYCASEGTKHW